MRYTTLYKAIIFCCFTTLSYGQEVVVTTGEFPPWTSETLEGGGFINQVISAAFTEQGHTVKFEYFPWARAMKNLELGLADASSYWFFSEKHKSKFLLSDPVTWQQLVFFYHTENPLHKWNSFSDLIDYTVGVSLGYTYPEELWDAFESGVNVQSASTDLLNFKKLTLRRIDLFPIEKIAGFELLRTELSKEKIKMISYHPKPLMSVSSHILFSTNAEKLRSDFNEGLKIITKNGLLDRYYQKMLESRYKDFLPIESSTSKPKLQE